MVRWRVAERGAEEKQRGKKGIVFFFFLCVCALARRPMLSLSSLSPSRFFLRSTHDMDHCLSMIETENDFQKDRWAIELCLYVFVEEMLGTEREVEETYTSPHTSHLIVTLDAKRVRVELGVFLPILHPPYYPDHYTLFVELVRTSAVLC